MPDRDPRKEPKPGDIVRGKKSDRVVIALDKGGIWFVYWQLDSAGRGNDCYCLLNTWRKWAKGAEVIHRGD